jgi:hypothetical protein
MKLKRVHGTLWIVLLVGGFALGFVPEYQKNRELQGLLQNPQKEIDSLKLQVQLGELRDAASLMLLELSRQNYGLARDYAAQYYQKLKDATDSAQDPAFKKSLQDLAATRDNLTTQLATASPAALSAAQPIVVKTIEVTKAGK